MTKVSVASLDGLLYWLHAADGQLLACGLAGPVYCCLLCVCVSQPVPQAMSARIMREARAQQEELDAEELQQQQQTAAPALVRLTGQRPLGGLGGRGV